VFRKGGEWRDNSLQFLKYALKPDLPCLTMRQGSLY
jgi:hypothetical protein